MGTTYATPQVTIAAGASVTFSRSDAGLSGLINATAHTIQVMGAGTATIRGQMFNAAGLSQIGDPVTTGIYTFAAHHLQELQVTNSGASAITVTLAGG